MNWLDAIMFPIVVTAWLFYLMMMSPDCVSNVVGLCLMELAITYLLLLIFLKTRLMSWFFLMLSDLFPVFVCLKRK